MLKIERIYAQGASVTTQKITGFKDGELRKLKDLPHTQAEGLLIRMLDERNDGTGSQWKNKYGILGLWFDNEAAYVNIGKPCD